MSVTGEQIREQLRLMPFRPFRLQLVDQRTFEVHHPDFAMVVPNRRHLIVFSMENLESWCMIDVALIASLQSIDERPSASQAA
jgi:hypothetical protein